MNLKNKTTYSGLITYAFGALGIVFGDIGTSPIVALTASLYAISEPLSVPIILGIISLIFWALILIVCVKYLLFITQAEKNGEGGIFAVLAILKSSNRLGKQMLFFSTIIAILAAALLIADSMLTPALAVLSAVEGLKMTFDNIDHWILLITVFLIAGLFLIQRFGTGRLGQLFGPIMLTWFIAIGALGMIQIIRNPLILIAISPLYAINLIIDLGPANTFSLLGSVMIAVTGAEAIYADMGHFGMKPIKVAWYGLALFSLLLNYFGQGAWLIQHIEKGESIELPFFALIPHNLLIPMVFLATCASIIASQAVISGMFSLASQAIQLRFLPRLKIIHTSFLSRGQIYIPKINALLAIGSLSLVISFGSSAALANAYGFAVSATMFLTTLAFTLVIYYVWKWSWLSILAFVAFAIPLDCVFLLATLTKIPQGSYVTLIIAFVFSALMASWLLGNHYLQGRAQRLDLPLPLFADSITDRHDLQLITRPAVFLQHLDFEPELEITPNALLRQVQLTSILYQPSIIVELNTLHEPRVPDNERLHITAYSSGLYRVSIDFGFYEMKTLQPLEAYGLEKGWWSESKDIVYFTANEQLRSCKPHTLPFWVRWPYYLMHLNDEGSAKALNLPNAQYVELNLTIDV